MNDHIDRWLEDVRRQGEHLRQKTEIDARPEEACEPCWKGDHRFHRAELDGACPGCDCRAHLTGYLRLPPGGEKR